MKTQEESTDRHSCGINKRRIKTSSKFEKEMLSLNGSRDCSGLEFETLLTDENGDAEKNVHNNAHNLETLHLKNLSNGGTKNQESSEDVFISTPNMVLHFKTPPFATKTSKSHEYADKLTKTTDPEPLQNEPLKTWLLLVNVFLFNVICGYHFLNFGVYYVEWTRAFNTTKAAAGVIGALTESTACCSGIFATVILEKLGPRSCGSLGALIMAAGVFSTAFAPSIYVIYVTYGLITGFGVAVPGLPAIVLIQTHFHKHRTFATSISFVGLPCGNLIAPNLTNLFVDIFGWRGALIMHSGIILNAFVLIQLWPKQNTDNSIDKEAASSKTCKRFVDLSVFKDPLVSLHIFSSALYHFAIVVIFDHTPSRAVHLGSQLQQAALLMTVMCAGSLTFRSLSSIVMRFVNPLMSHAMVMGSQAVCALGITFTTSYRQVVGIMFLIGCAQGFAVPSAILSIVKLTSVSRYARTSAVTNLMAGISSLLATPVTGLLFDVTQNYDVPFYAAAAFGITAFIGEFVVFILNRRKDIATGMNDKPALKTDDVVDLNNYRYDVQTRRIRKITF